MDAQHNPLDEREENSRPDHNADNRSSRRHHENDRNGQDDRSEHRAEAHAQGDNSDYAEPAGDEHSPPDITPPPKLPPAKSGKALFLIGAIVLVLVAAGVVAMLLRIHDSRVLAETTETRCRSHRCRGSSHGGEAGRRTGPAGHVTGLY